jgi:hypothetical protein
VVGGSNRRALGAAVAALAGAVSLLFLAGDHYPVQQWLSLRYARAIFFAVVFAFASLSAGRRLFELLGVNGARFDERALLSFVLGVLAFYLGLFLGGLVGLQGPVLFALLPLALGASGFGLLRRDFRALRRHRLIPLKTRALLPKSAVELGAALLLLAGVSVLYLQILTPDNVGYDAEWYHLPLAEDFALHGVHRFRDGWYLAAYPQLGSTLYSWAFQEPLVGTFDRVTLASHLEWVLFVATLCGVGLLARRLARSGRMRFASAAVFLFPGIFIYDSNLITGADHVLAFWAAPIALFTSMAARNPTRGPFLGAAACLAGAALTKYQAIYLVVPGCLALLVIAVRARAFAALGLAAAACLALTAPHWLKNFVYYGDPIYPLLYRHLTLDPFHEGAGKLVAETYQMPDFAPQGSFGEKLWETLKSLVTFWVDPKDIWNFHRNVPIFGPIFPLLIVPLAFAKKTRRIWVLIAATMLGMAIFWWTNHQERFLQALLPWFAAATAAALLRIWALGLAARACVSVLVGVALIYGGDSWFFPRNGWPQIAHAARHLSASIDGNPPDRVKRWSAVARVSKQLPEDAVVLLHGERFAVGLRRPFVTDDRGYQGATDYAVLGTPARVRQHLQDLGVTHVLLARFPDFGISPETLARETVFHWFLQSTGDPVWSSDVHELYRVRAPARERDDDGDVIVLACREPFESGYYRLSDFAKKKKPRRDVTPDELFTDGRKPSNVAAILLQGDCSKLKPVRERILKHFHVAATYWGDELFFPGERKPPKKGKKRRKRP